jgi:hypothetical protein
MTGRLLTRLFALFGMTLTCVACYGVEYTEFNPEFGAAGRVIDEEGTPIEGIRVHGSRAETSTDADGRFYVRAIEPFVILTDVDGEANGGEFEEKAISFNSTGTNIDLGDIELERK